MVVRVEVEPAVLAWARERSGLDEDYIYSRFPKLEAWEQRALQPTLRQLEEYASATHTAVGLLLLSEPPQEPLPIPDFRTMGGKEISRPTADLLDTIYLCQQRQEWYHDYSRLNGDPPLAFVGSLQASIDVVDAADVIRDQLNFGVDARLEFSSWSEALRGLADSAEALGVLVMISGIVGSNTHRVLNPAEFRGFALVDDLAPVVFINGADTKAAQIFTLAHELAHIWVAAPGLSNATLASVPSIELERWCNAVAAEFLVPLTAVRAEYQPRAEDFTDELNRLARRFKVSTLVVLGRLRDANFLTQERFRSLYSEELARVLALRAGGEGGNFYNTQPVRASKRFSRAIIASTLEGQTLYRDATRLLGFKKLSTLDKLAESLGVA